jgi:hypothetical protein
MRKPRLFSVFLLGAAALALLIPGGGPLADDDDGPLASPPPSGGKAAGFPLSLSPARQRQSGLKTQALAAFSLAQEAPAYGRVVDLSPLLDLRARYRAAQSELAVAEAALEVARKSQARLSKLHAESIIAARDLIQADAQLAADQARRDAAFRHVRDVREEALQSFGEELFRQAAEAESRLFGGLLRHEQVLALVALPANASLPKAVRAVAVAPSGEPGKARPARLLSPAPRTEESTQGETWFFVADAAGLRTGMRLDVWIPQGGAAAAGVLVPLAAVVWRDGLPWVFVKAGEGGFVRRPVGAPRLRGEDWFVAEGFAPGEEVVVVGGQMLLSEEQRRDSPKSGDDD